MTTMHTDKMVGVQPCQTILRHYIEVDLQIPPHNPMHTLTLPKGHYLSMVDSTVSFDYMVNLEGCRKIIYIDAKDKRDFNPKNWDTPLEEIDDWFIFDETAVRKMLNGGRNYFFLMNDYRQNRLLLWTSQAIGLGRRKWARRDLAGGYCKWKLMYHISSANLWTHSVDYAVKFMVEWVNKKAVETAHNIHETYCFEEDYIVAGVVRGDQYREHDVASQGGQ